MTTEVERYRSLPMSAKWEYVSRLAAAEDLLPKEFYGPKDVPPAQRRVLPGKVFLVVEFGAMLGVPALAAINGIHVIEGKPSMSAAMMTGLVRTAGHKIRVRETGTVEGGDYSATATLIRSDDPDEEITATWTPFRAVRAELVQTYERDAGGIFRPKARSRDGNAMNWEKYTENMCKWRAISEVCRFGADDVFMGSAYTPEELGELPSAAAGGARDADLVAALEAASTADAAEKLYRGWVGEGAVSQEVASVAMRRVAELAASEEAGRAAAPAGAGEEIATPVDESPTEEPEAVQSHTEPEPVPVEEEDELVRDARKVMTDDEFEAWISTRGAGRE